MADSNTPQGREGEVRRPDPNAAAQDPENARRQEQVARDHDALEEQRRRVEATTPPDVRDRTVNEMTEDLNRRADADRTR